MWLARLIEREYKPRCVSYQLSTGESRREEKKRKGEKLREDRRQASENWRWSPQMYYYNVLIVCLFAT